MYFYLPDGRLEEERSGLYAHDIRISEFDPDHISYLGKNAKTYFVNGDSEWKNNDKVYTAEE